LGVDLLSRPEDKAAGHLLPPLLDPPLEGPQLAVSEVTGKFLLKANKQILCRRGGLSLRTIAPFFCSTHA